MRKTNPQSLNSTAPLRQSKYDRLISLKNIFRTMKPSLYVIVAAILGMIAVVALT